jgi:hypothetical protein
MMPANFPRNIAITQADLDDATGLIDRYGVYGTMQILSDVLHSKARHARKYWPERPALSRRWDRLGHKFNELSNKLDDPSND